MRTLGELPPITALALCALLPLAACDTVSPPVRDPELGIDVPEQWTAAEAPPRSASCRLALLPSPKLNDCFTAV